MTNKELFNSMPKVKKKRLNVLPKNPEPPNTLKIVGPGRFPSWLHRKLPKGGELRKTENILGENRLYTVCEEAKCPNLLECWSKKTATFLVMGKACTRNCGFCDIDFTKAPLPLDFDEPHRVAASVKQLDLQHVVITMVARDDLIDGGAEHLTAVIEAIREQNPQSIIEVLTSDFCGNQKALDAIISSRPEIFNHNIETVRELTPRVRHKATYDRTLSVLKYVAQHKSMQELWIKSGIMVGLGESKEQVYQTIKDLHQAGTEIITIGQYLQPNTNKLLVKEFIHPEQFKDYEEYGHSIGVKHMFCGPFVRSSYNAALTLKKVSTT